MVGLATSYGLIVLILWWCRRFNFAGRAIELHHSHTIPVSRLGGIALAGPMVVVTLLFYGFSGPGFIQQNDRWVIIPCSLAMFGLGLLDDLLGLGARRKLLGQIAIASATFFCGIGIAHFKIPLTDHIIDLGLWALPVTVVWLVAMTNLINLIDGVDGLAGGICLMLMILLIYVSLQGGSVPVIAAGMAGALLAFLRFNFPPARIYMGDGGAYFLGFFIGASTIVSSQKGTIVAALLAPLFVLALPILDTSVAIIRRGLQGLPVFRPDRKHIHHRLLAAGHSRRKVVLGLYIFTAIFLLLGFMTFFLHGQYLPLLLGIGVLTILFAAGQFNFSREWLVVGRVLGNSLDARQDIRYAISLSRWLALEGKRANTLDDLAEDVIFMARKLGFDSVQIRLEDGEKHWRLTSLDTQNCRLFRHAVSGHKYCFLELGIASKSARRPPATGVSIKTTSVSDILADLLAEGWGQALSDWQTIHGLPLRFDSCPLVPPMDETSQPYSPVHLANVPAAGQQKSAPKIIPGTPP
ncbi:MAG TPA: MraY family glycosyltransferase [Verrucomicrobiae bacterium]|nr:MraY family glycosyltransferase [Verrucomicrobiae bacterium]